jgi:hypothetical protein
MSGSEVKKYSDLIGQQLIVADGLSTRNLNRTTLSSYLRAFDTLVSTSAGM